MTKSDIFIPGILLLFFVQSCVQSYLSDLPSRAHLSITTGDLKTHVAYLAADELGGRYSFGTGNIQAAKYLREKLASYDYQGAGSDGSFFQRVLVSRHKVDPEKSGLTLHFGDKVRTLAYQTDYIPEIPNQMIENVSGVLVFVGYGISSPRNNHDDYAGLDVRGKFVITVKGAPERLKNVDLEPHEVRNQAAISHGARGNIVISAGLLSAYAGFSSDYSDRKFTRLLDEQSGMYDHIVEMGFQLGTSEESLQIILAGPGLVAALVEAMGRDQSYLTEPNGEPRPPQMVAATIEVRTIFMEVESGETYNVLGVLEGADPQLETNMSFSVHIMMGLGVPTTKPFTMLRMTTHRARRLFLKSPRL